MGLSVLETLVFWFAGVLAFGVLIEKERRKWE
jgi:hypothetical protein